ncbi:phosphate acyltransferase PlsX [Isachenkonia alkalipeptolytica]|uniref:Phosphate acyltransferase n=1 Tax=Isachenkonia alkalipeptolytica TaxID=2565777 RepID=A0AA43XLS7_9CLOT|nr:phosphate acyltransferase PlsX [Isachenkonia alkalipeptolytica]NBG89110.1 phosphate acyltransferase PlsX [Isachenkonia alkalipeptolytica]
MILAIDGMGGDHAPKSTVKGAVDAVKEYGITVMITGDQEVLSKELQQYDYDKEKIEIIHCSEKIENEDPPVKAIRRKKDSSMVVALNLVKEGRAEAVISAGNTGALLAGGLFVLGRIKGIDRPALAPVFPHENGASVLIDGGANTECKGKNLLQFGVMGSLYSEHILGVKSPKVSLVNVGEEKGKGNELTKEAYDLLEESDLNFTGNMEARDLPRGKTDVIVCDGFTGNIILKLTEGVFMTVFDLLKEKFTKSFMTKMAAGILKPELRQIKKDYDYTEHGGAPFLGVQGVLIKAHGSSDGKAVKNALRQGKRFAENKIVDKIQESLGN